MLIRNKRKTHLCARHCYARSSLRFGNRAPERVCVCVIYFHNSIRLIKNEENRILIKSPVRQMCSHTHLCTTCIHTSPTCDQSASTRVRVKWAYRCLTCFSITFHQMCWPNAKREICAHECVRPATAHTHTQRDVRVCVSATVDAWALCCAARPRWHQHRINKPSIQCRRIQCAQVGCV